MDGKAVGTHQSFLFFHPFGYETDRPALDLAPFGGPSNKDRQPGLQYTDDARRGSGLPAELIDHAGTRKEERRMSLYLLVVTVIRV